MLARSAQNRYTICEVLSGRYTWPQYVVTLPGLRHWRLKSALSQRDLARLSGVAASTIARAEQGKETHPSTMGKLAKTLKCAPSDLMEPEQTKEGTR